MDLTRFFMMTVLEIVRDLARGANRPDLVEKCCECEVEVKALDEPEKVEG